MEVPKFRLLDKNKGNVIDSSKIMNINFENESIIVLDKILEEDNFTQKDYLEYAFKNVEFMQSTGLFDKNGKEIFEGDIVKMAKDVYSDPTHYEVVRYRGGAYRLESKQHGCELWLRHTDCEVVGNVCENQEYLKKRGN